MAPTVKAVASIVPLLIMEDSVKTFVNAKGNFITPYIKKRLDSNHRLTAEQIIPK